MNVLRLVLANFSFVEPAKSRDERPKKLDKPATSNKGKTIAVISDARSGGTFNQQRARQQEAFKIFTKAAESRLGFFSHAEILVKVESQL